MKKTFFPLLALSGLAALSVVSPARADDGIFPAAPAAKAAIDFDGRGFLIRGNRTFIASGSLHYSRVPRALWRDRLLKFKRAGFNTVQTYVYWNIHEPKPGQFNFQGDADLGAFLSLAQSLGMYAVVRVGPYYCAEWDFGGYPVWLRNVPGLQVRVDNEPFKKAVGAFFDKLLPIVKAHEIHRGGNVIMVQLENEHPKGWGREMPDGYFRFLRDRYVAAGLEVPYFFSGLHHGSDPAGNRSWDSAGRDNPWYTTEFWPGWFDLYGALPPDRQLFFDRGTWKIIAYGGNGYNYYMLHGGTNFDYTNNNEDASSYDYGAAVGQAGDLRPIYTRFKRAATFATSFESVLASSQNADVKYQAITSDPAVKVTARQSPAGALIFLDNYGKESRQVQVRRPGGTDTAPITLEAGEIMPVVQDYALAPQVMLTWAPTRVAGVSRQNNVTTLVVHGQVNTPAELHFSTSGPVLSVSPLLTRTGPDITFRATFADTPRVAEFTVGGKTVRVVALPTVLADRAWFVEVDNRKAIVVGPEYVGDVTFKNKQWQISTERPWSTRQVYPTTIYSGDEVVTLPAALLPAIKRRVSLSLSDWQRGEGSQPAQVSFNDGAWMSAVQPPQMGSDNDISCYAWYRTGVTISRAGTYRFSGGAGGDLMSTWVDGKPVAPAVAPGKALDVNLTAGKHTLAVFVSHNGRDKLFGYLGPVSNIDVKGLGSNASLFQAVSAPQTLGGWKVLKLASAPTTDTPPTPDATWADYQIGQDAFNRRPGDAWFSTTLPALASDGTKILHFDSVDEDATVYLNGQKIGAHKGWNQGFDVDLTSAWKTGAPNQLAILIHNQENTGGIDKPVTVSSALFTPLGPWKLRGGPKAEGESIAYKPLAGATATDGPTWYRASFDAPVGGRGVTVWRVKPNGLSRGSVWLNGHNLGRYPEKIPVDGLYLPECWLRDGKNTLEIFDEQGKAPSQVVIEAEADASRDGQVVLLK